MNEIPSITEAGCPEAVINEPLEMPITENQDTSPDRDENKDAEIASVSSTVTPKDEDALEGDLDALRLHFPELQRMDNIEKLPSYVRYSELRALGLTPEEAYLATGRRGEVRDNRAHLTSAVPIAASSPRGISRRELGIARELFSDLSDSEIQSLYQRVTK